MSTPMTSRETFHHGNLGPALRRAALELVREHGVRGFKLRAAAREVGVDPAAIYRHFRDRDGLLGAVSRDGFTELAARMRSATDDAPDPEDQLRAIGAAYVQFALDEPEWFRLMFGPIAPEADEGADNPYALLVEALEGLAQDGRCARPLRPAAVSAWSAVHGLALLLVEGRLPDGEAQTAVRAVLDTTVRGIRGDAD